MRVPDAEAARSGAGRSTKAERSVLAATLVAALLVMTGLLVGLHLVLQDYVIRMEPWLY